MQTTAQKHGEDRGEMALPSVRAWRKSCSSRPALNASHANRYLSSLGYVGKRYRSNRS